jgi:peroxiredoxin
LAERDAQALQQVPAEVREYERWLSTLFESTECARTFLVVAEHPGTVDDVVADSGLTHDTVADHLGTLQKLGIIRTETDQGRTVYRLDEARIRRAAEALASKPSDVRTLGSRPAPRFVLPSADGQEVALSDCLEAGPVALWFSGGLACPVCRRNRARLSLCYPAIRSLGAELLEVTPTPDDHARLYFSHFPVSFPYLCDPDRRVWEQYRLRPGRLGSLHVLSLLLPDALGPKSIVRDWLSGLHFQGTPAEHQSLGNEYGFFLIDRTGMIRSAEAGPYMGLPSNDEIERRLREIMV